MNKKIYGTFFIFFLLIPLLTFADVGPKPGIRLEIYLDGKNLESDALICNDALFPLNKKLSESSPVYGMVEDLLINEKGNCYICEKGSCSQWFYSLPKKLKVVYPIIQNQKIFENSEEYKDILFVDKTSDTKVYSTEIASYTSRFPTIKANLNENGTITLIPDNPLLSTSYLFFVLMALFLTLFIELLIAYFAALVFKKSTRILKTVFFMNLISVPILWFLFPFLINKILPDQFFLVSFAIGEVFVLIFETAILSKFHHDELSFGKTVLFSIVLNANSMAFGGMLMIILSLFINLY